MTRRQRCCAFSLHIYTLLVFSLFPLVAESFKGYAVLVSGQADSETSSKTAVLQGSNTKIAKGNIQLAATNGKATSAADRLIISEIEKGSPASLKSAVNRLRQQGINMSDSSKLLLYVASSIYTIVYPTERINWDIPAISSNSVYYNAIESAKQGAYYSIPSQNADFLSLVLPSLILITAPNVKNFYDDAEIALQTALKMNSNSALANYLLGTLYDRKGNFAKSIVHFESAFKIQSDCVTLAMPYIESLINVGRNKDAYNSAVKVLLKNNGNIDILKLCAESAFAMKDWELADQYISQVLQSDPSNARFLLLRSRILLESGDYIRASAALDSYAKNEKPTKEYYIVKVRLLRDWNKNLTTASAVVTDAIKEYPENGEIILLAASIAANTGQKINGLSASQLSSKILSVDPNNTEALAIMIQEALKNQMWQTAYERCAKLMQLKNDAETKLLQIEASLGVRKFEEAQEIAESLYKENPDNESVQQMYINVLITTKNTSKAASLIESLLPKASQKAKSVLYYHRSRIASTQASKLNDLRNSLTSNPRNQDALYDLYKHYYDKKDYRKALYYLKQVIAINPSDSKLIKQQAELDNLLAQ